MTTVYRYIPAGAIEHLDAETKAVVYTYDNGGPCAVAFHGKSAKPDWRYLFLSEDRRKEKMEEFFQSIRSYNARVAERRKERSQPHELVVGDILVSSWGYEQTNVDFNQVIELSGKQSVKIREIGQNTTTTVYMSGTATPEKDDFIGEIMTKRVNRNSIKLNSYAYAYKWDGKPKMWSSYA